MKNQDDFDPDCLFGRWINEGKAVEKLGTVSGGHLLIMPLRHTADGFTMTGPEIRDSEALICRLSEKIRKSDPCVCG